MTVRAAVAAIDDGERTKVAAITQRILGLELAIVIVRNFDAFGAVEHELRIAAERAFEKATFHRPADMTRIAEHQLRHRISAARIRPEIENLPSHFLCTSCRKSPLPHHWTGDLCNKLARPKFGPFL